jgi:hypothetical protein
MMLHTTTLRAQQERLSVMSAITNRFFKRHQSSGSSPIGSASSGSASFGSAWSFQFAGSIASASACLIAFLAVTLIPAPARAQQAQPSASSPNADMAPPQGKKFRTPEDASAALYAAAHRNDEAGLLMILGPDAKDLISWSDDPNQRREMHESFCQKYNQMHRLVKEPDDTVAIYVGAENWPVPIPLVEYKGAWYFDADLGKQEILYRRIGRNEMEAVQVCHALVESENEYYTAAYRYTDKFVSTHGHDGLYWTQTDGAKSPIGMHLAHAGIARSDGAGGADTRPFHGYYYRILLQGSSNQPSGQASGAFTVLAFPADYRSSGVMTFLMGQDGMAYEKDLGPNTPAMAKQMNSFNSDNSWKKVE